MELIPGVRGEGPILEIDGRRYRRRLLRAWGDENAPQRTVLWIGMNPSIADAVQDDRTCRREQLISMDLGFNKYLKGNILDIIETNPRQIPADLNAARTQGNMAEIRAMALEAEWVILAHGKLPARFQIAVQEIYRVFQQLDCQVATFQQNADGTPTHTRMVRNANIVDDLEQARFPL